MCDSLADGNHTGGSIGAGLFVGSGSAFQNGGPGSVVSVERAPPCEDMTLNAAF